jgi:hypothetical protein
MSPATKGKRGVRTALQNGQLLRCYHALTFLANPVYRAVLSRHCEALDREIEGTAQAHVEIR